MKNYHTGFRCLQCKKVYPCDYENYTCQVCNENLDALYDYEEIKRALSIDILKKNPKKDVWRYEPFFPIGNLDYIPDLDLSLTPLYKSSFLSSRAAGQNIYLKDDTRLPSASFKDRASSVVMAVAREKGIRVVSAASTGNAGCSWACMGASCGINVIIYVPKTAPRAKIAQLRVYGADVRIVDGTYDDAFDLCVADSKQENYFNRCTGYNPYTREGKKSVSFEIWEQLGYKIPGSVLVPVGDGNIISGVWKGFRDLKETGMIDKLPQIVAVQSEQSDAVIRTIERIKRENLNLDNFEIESVKATTRADSISVDKPRDARAAVLAVMETGGITVRVKDEDILNTIPILASNTGIFSEPAGVTSVAGLLKFIETRRIKELNDPVICLVTGNGLKDVDAVLKGQN